MADSEESSPNTSTLSNNYTDGLAEFGHVNNLLSPFKAMRPRKRLEEGKRKVGFVLNPSSGGGSAFGKWKNIVPKVRKLFGESWKMLMTEKMGDATKHAKQLIREGYNVIVSVGGDGTHNEVVNGYMQEGAKNLGVEFGILPYGTGGDLQRTLGLDRYNAEKQLETIAENDSILCDAGVIRCSPLEESEILHDGDAANVLNSKGEIERYFINIASAGLSGNIVNSLEHSWMKRYLGGRISFALQTVKGTFQYRNKRVRWRKDDSEEWHENMVYTLAVCNGQYQGGGMRMAPTADMYDGEFDLLLFENCGPSDIHLLFKIYNGTHVDPKATDKIKVMSCKTVDMLPLPEEEGDSVYIEVDGELPGRLPARFEILPEAVWLIAPFD